MDTTHAAPPANDPDEPHGHTEPMPFHKVNYLAIFILLVALTVVTVVVAFVHIESEMTKVLVALSIATIKAAFVALFFMHLKFEGKLIYLILLVPVFLSVVLVVSLIPDIVHGLPFERLVPYPGQGK